MKKLNLTIKGMHCQSCAKLIELELEEKVNEINVNYKTGKAEIDFDENKVTEDEIKEIIKKQEFEVKRG